MDFTLAHGTANDFILVTDLHGETDVTEVLARALCDRRQGIGADGVLRLAPPPDVDADVFMDHRNADGSTAQMCGNGVRVVAKHLLDHDLLPERGDRESDVVRVATRSGTKRVSVVARHADGSVASVAVDMGRPVLDTAAVPFRADDPEALIHTVHLDDPQLADALGKDAVEISVVSMGNPHAVLLVDDVTRAPVDTVGPWLETHVRFPEHANIGFAQVRSRTAIGLRVWERGVGETSACGTGACAAVVALQRRDLVDAEVDVRLPGGTLAIAHTGSGPVTMTGPAVEIASGTLDPSWMAAARRGEMEGGPS